ncbi:DUF6249 domain-containing protein [Pelomonas sp. APW6]|uniref:DUF6249 domain-containing protein n=1 Tax=Roseateles subflavus TaxID=3053353 RepID=A0ABT7LD06_9BURK|nr:DUF6249 domain-containing protein [Pelomonas sp. APW6]MDL5030738.1 DUF6249 domain-containing protein [Pelomonas sp. APW6]
MDNVNELFVAIGVTLAILASVAGPVIVLLRLMRHQTRQKEQRYRFLLELADRQQALPPELLLEPTPTDADRRRGLVLVSGGLGLFLTLVALPLEYNEGHRLSELWGLACLPLMVGLGYLVSWWLGERDARAGG